MIYRIIEKEGRYEKLPEELFLESNISKKLKDIYIPLYIVQKLASEVFCDFCDRETQLKYMYKDLKEFNDLELARKYKRSLELKDGVVIE